MLFIYLLIFIIIIIIYKYLSSIYIILNGINKRTHMAIDHTRLAKSKLHIIVCSAKILIT